MKKISFIVGLIFMYQYLIGQSEKYVKIKIPHSPETMKIIGESGIPVEGSIHNGICFITEVGESQLKMLDEKKISYELLIDDMANFYVERNLKSKGIESLRNCGNTVYYQTPQHFLHGTMGGFLTLNEIYDQLDSMRTLFPLLISEKQPLGNFYTHDGRQLYYVKISDNPDISENEPKVLYQALVHAREPMGMQQLFFFMWYLLENYTSNTEIQYLLNHAELHFVLCANPDGYEYNRQNHPNGGGMWRKNRRVSGNNNFGVDLNRNFGYMWGFDNIGSSPDPSTETYRGTTAFSEPETQAVKWLCETLNPILILDYHTYSDVLLYPWGYVNQKCPDSLLYDTYSSYLTSENRFDYGTAYQTIGYNANGGAYDWYYGEQTTKDKIIGWGPEAGSAADGFWPEENRIDEIAMNYMAMNFYLTRFVLNYAEIKDKTDDWIFGATQYFNYDLTRLGIENNGGFTVSLLPEDNIIYTGSSVNHTGLALLQTISDSVVYEVSPYVAPGDKIVFVAEVNNGFYSKYDTIVKTYGFPLELMHDECSSLAAWTGNWGISNTAYVSPFSSFTDSPTGNYQNNMVKTITTQNQIDLTNVLAARLSFYAKWDIEKGFDFAQLLISDDDGISWTPVCGKYTKNGTSYQDLNQPVYDGTKLQWIKEDINLENWLGKQIKFRFRMVSDGFLNADGFYFDDFKIEGIVYDPTQTEQFISNHVFLYPNPANEMITVGCIEEMKRISVYDFSGKLLMQSAPNEKQFDLNVQNISNGIYVLQIEGKTKKYVQKLFVQH